MNQQPVFVLSKSGKPLMPTKRFGKVRHLLKDGKAVIVKRNPFTIQLTYESPEYTQDIEICQDTGYQHIGLSIKTEKDEIVAEQYDLLPDEKQMHDDRRRYRRTRRNRKRYRKPRFNNRTSSKKKGWLAPSIKNKKDRHLDIIRKYCAVLPVKRIVIEGGQFDTQLLEAVESGKPLPKGKDYQNGPMAGFDTLREAVFQRDHHTCQICGRSITDKKDKPILHLHHTLYWKGRHGSQMNELLTVCEKCHTPANHQKGGKLYGLEPKLNRFEGAAFMNSVKWQIYSALKEEYPECDVYLTYGSATKRSRLNLKADKSHINDAWAMGDFHPENRAVPVYWKKKRRNNRVLCKFHDAQYIDSRDGKPKPGRELSNGRISRNHKKDSENLHKYRSRKVRKGQNYIRRQRYQYQSGDLVRYNGKIYTSCGCQHYGQYVKLKEPDKGVSVKKVVSIHQNNGWERIYM